MRLNKGSILIETLISMLVLMIIVELVLSFHQVNLVNREIMIQYEKGL